jgi:mono/diheme cytochrome c family protein
MSKRPEELPRIADYRDESQALHLRARSYLHANCAHCHRKWGGGNADFQTLALLAADQMGMIDVGPGQGRFDLKDPRLIVAGAPERSLISFRMTKQGLGRMPHVGSNVVDEYGAKLVRRWVESLASPAEQKRTGVIEP